MGKDGKAKRYTGPSGRIYANQRHKVQWGSKIFQGLTMHSWQNKHGISCIIKTRCSTEFLRRKFSLTAQSCKPQTQVQPLMHGRVFLGVEKSSKEEQFGGQVMDDQLHSGGSVGF